jgi:hypothetical protein
MDKLLLKNLPDPREYPILPPDMDYLYLEKAHLFPFEPLKTEFSLANCWWLSECAFLVYCHPGFARMAMKLAGFDNFRFFQGKGTECMVCWNHEAVILSFRGTEMKSLSALHELRTDLDTAPVPFESGGMVHKGFLKGLEEVWSGSDGLEKFITDLMAKDPERPLWISGHSLGGALAALCFTRLPKATGVYLFGAPRIGDQQFINLTKGRPVWRVEHGRDPIPLVPPDVPQLKFNFKDLGELIFIDKEGSILTERPVVTVSEEKDKVLATFSDQKKRRDSLSHDLKINKIDKETVKNFISEINEHFVQSINEWKDYLESLDEGIGLKIQDHMPIYYCSKLWNALVKDQN